MAYHLCDPPHWHEPASGGVRGGGHRGDMPHLLFMIVDSTSEKHHTATSIDSDDRVVLLRSIVGHYDGVLWDIITTTTTRTGRGACGGVTEVICHNSSS